jgi:hypothetical protein
LTRKATSRCCEVVSLFETARAEQAVITNSNKESANPPEPDIARSAQPPVVSLFLSCGFSSKQLQFVIVGHVLPPIRRFADSPIRRFADSPQT